MAKATDAKITVSVDTDALSALKQVFENIGMVLNQTYAQIKPTIQALGSIGMPKPITPEQIALAFGVPPEMIGLLPPDAGVSIQKAVTDGTLTGEAYVYADGGVLKDWTPPEVSDIGPYEPQAYTAAELSSWGSAIHAGDYLPPLADCLTNNSPYVNGQLGINAMLAQKTEQNMPHKSFSAKEPDPDSPTAGIPAHAVFTSPLIHSQETIEEMAKKLLKTTGDVKIAQLDEQGNPTGKLITLGQISDFDFSPNVMNPDDYKLAQSWPPEPPEPLLIHTLNYPFNLSNPTPFPQLVAEAALEVEQQVVGAYLGVDLTKDSGNVLVAWQDPADGMIHLRADDADGQEVKQGALTYAEAQKLIEKADKVWKKDQPLTPSPFSVGQFWNHDWQHPIGQASDHDFVDLGHEEAVAEALAQKEKLVKLQGKVSDHASGTAVDFNAQAYSVMGKADPVVVTGLHSKTHHLAHGATLIEYPDGVSTLDLPGMVTVPGKGLCKLHGKFTLPTEQAKKIAGLVPVEPGGSDVASTMQWAYGEPYVWDPKKGWQPATWQPATPPAMDHMHVEVTAKAEPNLVQKMMDAFPALFTATGGITFPTPYDDVPEDFYVTEDPDHGEQLVPIPGEPTAWYDEAGQLIEESLFEVPTGFVIPKEAHLWCMACDCHWVEHTGDPVACDSGGYLRPSTPLEDKTLVTRMNMLKATGLA